MNKLTEIIKTDRNLKLIKTNKFKNINVYIKCAYKYSVELKTKLYLLSSLYLETSDKYQDKVSMGKIRDMLYGIGCYCSLGNTGDLLTFTIHFDYVNPKFIKGVSEKDYLNYIEEIMKHPLFREDLLNEAKRVMKDNLLRNLDEPSVFANDRFFEELSKENEKFDTYRVSDILNFIDKITLDDINDAYNNLFKSRVDIFVVGDYDDLLIDYLRQFESKADIHLTLERNNFMPIKDVTDKKDISQSTLVVAYDTPYIRSDKDYYAFNLGNILFGGIPSSLLFAEVREKHSLCYTISARSYRFEGLCVVKTMIEADKKDKTLSEIRKQFKRIVDKDYDMELLDVAKVMLINNTLSIDDDLDYLIDYTYNGLLSGVVESHLDYLEKIKSVTVDDIAKAFANYNEHLVYFLEGTKHE